jgi:hypothetical protein
MFLLCAMNSYVWLPAISWDGLAAREDAAAPFVLLSAAAYKTFYPAVSKPQEV